MAGRVVRTETDLIATIRELASRTRVFFKDTTDYACPGLLADRCFLREVTHTFIIRHPREVIPSHFALTPNWGVTKSASRGWDYCEWVGLPFHADRLSWQPKMSEEWRKTERWHRDAGQTSGFVSTRTGHEPTSRKSTNTPGTIRSGSGSSRH